MPKKVTVVGGGNGSSLVLQALLKCGGKFSISAVIAMSDSGGSSGRLREEYHSLPPGDIMRAVLSLSTKYEYETLKDIFYGSRFSDIFKLDGHNLGNLFIMWAARYGKDFMSGVRALEQIVQADGHVFPSTLMRTNLCAELSDGSIITGETNIDRPTHDRALKIRRVWLAPAVSAADEAERVIKEADWIILAPGSLYTSVVAALLPAGIQAAFAGSRARIMAVCQNSFEANGEAGPETLSERVLALEKYLPRPVDVVAYTDSDLDENQKAKYNEERWQILLKDEDNLMGRVIIRADFEDKEGGVSSDKLSSVLSGLLVK